MATQQFQDQDITIPNQTWGILLISILGLFLETLFIRWIGTEIRIFAYLQNTILVACFLGLGLGMLTSAKPINLKQSLIPMVILLTLMAIPVTRSSLSQISEMLSSMGDFIVWYSIPTNDRSEQIGLTLIGLILTFVVLVLLVDIFVQFGRILGRLMNANPRPIWAYSVNIFGSILGTWLFVLLSFFYQPPFVWFLIVGIILAIFIFWSNRDKKINFALLVLIMGLSWYAGKVPGAIKVVWSPYQKLVVQESLSRKIGGYLINVNNVGYQGMLDLRNAHISANPKVFPPKLKGLSQYDIPFLLHPNPKSALLVGAGSGNDAAGALRHSVASITAVEIDPAIIAIGQEFHPEHPYSSSQVRVVNDDARSFFATTNEYYDVISFGLLDSHTTTSLTNARLDHYVYTKESVAQAKSKLAPGGVMVLTFESQQPFITDRIERALTESFNQPPIVFRIPSNAYGWGGVMFVTGDLQVVQKQLDQNARLASYIRELQAAYALQFPHTTRVITDDWPYLYLASARIPLLYYLLIVLMILAFMISNKRWQGNIGMSYRNRNFLHFFFLGAAFLLLEVQNISKASVVLGNKWQVNAVIISSILGMALLANWVAYKFPNLPLPPVYLLLIGTALGLYFLDLARFGFLPYLLKAVIVGSLTSLPMLFSGIVFVRSFAIADDKSNALGANLIGSLAGALLQSVTFIIGIKALLLIVAGFYLLSLLTNSQPNATRIPVVNEFAES